MIGSRAAWLLLCAAAFACAPHAIRDLGPEPSLTPLDASIRATRRDTIELDLNMARAAYVTVVAVERGSWIKVLVPGAHTTSAWLERGSHRLIVQPVQRAERLARSPEYSDPELKGRLPLPEPRIGGIGSPPLELCPDATPYEPRYCPVSPTEALYAPSLPPTRYLLVIATEDPLDLGTLQERLTRVDLGADGRGLLTEVAFYAVGPHVPWAGYGMRR